MHPVVELGGHGAGIENLLPLSGAIPRVRIPKDVRTSGAAPSGKKVNGWNHTAGIGDLLSPSDAGTPKPAGRQSLIGFMADGAEGGHRVLYLAMQVRGQT